MNRAVLYRVGQEKGCLVDRVLESVKTVESQNISWTEARNDNTPLQSRIHVIWHVVAVLELMAWSCLCTRLLKCE
jgi:hypothetical protein